MTSQIRVDEITNRSGLGTVTIYDNGFEFTGVTTFTEDVDITGGLTIGGVLTYEDVTNIDSVGVVTARAGIRVTGDSIHVESSEDRLLYLKSTDANAYLTFEDTDSSSAFANRVGTVSDGLYFSTGGGGERLRIDSSGRLLIGRTTALASSAERLTINDGMAMFRRNNSNAAAVYIRNEDTTADTRQPYLIFTDGSGNRGGFGVQYNESSLWISGQNGIAFRTGGSAPSTTERLRITSAGNVSIGSLTDDSIGSTTTLTIDRSSGNGQISFAANGTVRGRIFADNSTSDFRIGNPTSNDLMLYTNNLERLRITSAGNIGIGINNPAYELEVASSDTTTFNITAGGNTNLSRLFFSDDDAVARGYLNYDHQADSLLIATAGTERLRIHSSGVAQFTTTGTQYPSATAPAFVVNSNGDHALVINNQNTTDPRGLFIYQDQDVNNGTSYFWRARAGGTDRAHLYSNGTLQLHSGNLKLASGNGIDFSATANSSGTMSSELLDDYEEGTFTPNDASGAGLTLAEAAGIYTRVGRMVHVQVRVRYPTTSNTSYASIGGFPFSATNQGTNISNGANASGFGYFTGSSIPQIHMSASGTHTNFYILSTIQRNNNLSGRELRFGVVYSTT